MMGAVYGIAIVVVLSLLGWLNRTDKGVSR